MAVGIGWGAGNYPSLLQTPSQQAVPSPSQAVTPQFVAQDMSLDALSGGVPTGLAITLLDEELLPEPEEENG